MDKIAFVKDQIAVMRKESWLTKKWEIGEKKGQEPLVYQSNGSLVL